MKILTINGIKNRGKKNTDKMGKLLADQGFDVFDVNYPKVYALTSRYRSIQNKNAKILLNAANDGDILIAHSYGCLLALRAMELGAKFSKVFFFAPAMNRDFIFPYLGMTELYVIHNKTDKAIKWGSWLRSHDFGKMGSHGTNSIPEDPRVTNIEDFSGKKGEENHSHYFASVNGHYFKEENINHWVNFIKDKIK